MFNPKGHAVDEGHPVRVVIIGAGVSGIALYIRLLQYVPAVTVTIFEKNPSLGGTWYENRYPGVACDIPSHVYQYSFEPNPEWSKLFAEGPEILEYVKAVARKYRVDEKIRYSSKVIGATWDGEQGVWSIEVEISDAQGRISTQKTSAEVVISATGILNNWKWPDIEGLSAFEGKLVHSADWDMSWNYEGKTVALIGCGSSAIQILPHLQKKCSRVYNFVRGGTWISYPFGSTLTEGILKNSDEPGNYKYTPEERARFLSDQQFYLDFRRTMESFINKDFPCLFPGSVEEVDGTKKIRDTMRQKLSAKPGLYEVLEPSFTPGCRRLTPGPGYLEALVKDNVELIKTPIVCAREDSILTEDGKEWEVDAIVCATGFDTSYHPRFPIIGRGGQSLSDRWGSRATAYMSHSVPGFPNYFMVGGPNSATGGGSLLLILESVIGYVVKAVQKISREHLKAMEAKEDALDAWVTYLDKYFPDTVHVDVCTSWYKVNGNIVGLWPGSSLHAMKALDNPRWEDYEYELLRESGRLDWIGNGWTLEDMRRGNLGYYVDTPDLPPIPTYQVITRQP
ncbi:putative Monooxygenase [Pleurostoma richardsiae]|uniref:Monooxygenase n=1 Tax=Pleurostoma richardsiae TaxID=41990 RepID=A0AA38RHC9_9PEZI|nr:putative Monooxygenase [Pleurostoma richardsiae]